MNDDNPSDIDRFNAKLKAAQERIEGGGDKGSANYTDNLAGVAMRISIELVVGLCVGLGIGWLIDRSLGTKPWFMLGFMFLGLGAGIFNVARLARQIERGSAEAHGKKD